MNLTNEQLSLLFRCVGGGPIDKAKIIVFGNELGTSEAGGNTQTTIEHFQHDWTSNPVLPVGEGFVTLKFGVLPVNSVFLQFISRMALAIRHKEDRFFDSLTFEGRAFLNNYIMNELYRTDTAVLNLKPLPQTSEKHWDYTNVNEDGYHNLFNFNLRRSQENSWKNLRLSVMKFAFEMAQNALILGSGDKKNKRAFLQLMYNNNIQFDDVILENGLEIYVSKKPKIILSNYYSPYSLGLDGLKQIYHYIIKNEML